MRQGRCQRGFTLVELAMVIAIIGILITIATMYWSSMQKKGFIEKEVTKIYSTLMSVRLQALYTKTPRRVTFSGKVMKIYPGTDATVPPVESITMTYPMVTTGGVNQVDFDIDGLNLTGETAICVDPTGTMGSNAGNTDSVDVMAAKIFMGKRQSGATCDPKNIDQK